MIPGCTLRPGKLWTVEDRESVAAYLLEKYRPSLIGTGAGGMRWTEFCKIPARFPDTDFDRPAAGWMIALEKLRRGFDPAKMAFDPWIGSTQLLASLEGKRPDCLDRPWLDWKDADRAEALDYVGGSLNERHNRKFFARLVVAKIRHRLTVTRYVRVDRLIRWNSGEGGVEEFDALFTGFDPGFGTFELWWLACLCHWIGLR